MFFQHLLIIPPQQKHHNFLSEKAKRWWRQKILMHTVSLCVYLVYYIDVTFMPSVWWALYGYVPGLWYTVNSLKNNREPINQTSKWFFSHEYFCKSFLLNQEQKSQTCAIYCLHFYHIHFIYQWIKKLVNAIYNT